MVYHEDENGYVSPESDEMEETRTEVEQAATFDRAKFLKKLGSTVFASLLVPAVFKDQFSAKANDPADTAPEFPILPEPTEDEDILVRMMRDVQRAMKKPVDQRRWSMVIDLRKCVGCHSCTISCAAENKLPDGVIYRPVMEEEIGTYPHVSKRFIPRPCMQCDEPPCVDACPVNATWMRKDGIVEIDYKQCIGCRYCITACPYGSRVFDSGFSYMDGLPSKGEAYLSPEGAIVYEKAPAYEYGKKMPREDHQSPIGNVRKCHFCLHRIEKGLLPQCTVSCIGRATYFGDANDPESLVSELIGKPNIMVLKEEMGTKPKVYYLV